jgi:hypothetical protein
VKEYFIVKDKNQLGPFTISELEEQGITNNTLVWKNGMKEWIRALEVDELKNIIKQTPPPLSTFTSKRISIKTAKVLKYSFFYIILVLVMTGLSYLILNYLVFRPDDIWKQQKAFVAQIYETKKDPFGYSYPYAKELEEKGNEAETNTVDGTWISFFIVLSALPAYKIIKWIIHNSQKKL